MRDGWPGDRICGLTRARKPTVAHSRIPQHTSPPHRKALHAQYPAGILEPLLAELGT